MRRKRNRGIVMLLILSLIISVLPCHSLTVSAADRTEELTGDAADYGQDNAAMDDLKVTANQSYAAAYSSASDYLDIGNCGANLTYVLSSNGVLSITGEGDMTNYSDASLVPWFRYRSLITTVNFNGNITSIGAYAFDFCVSLTSISISDSVASIGAYSFYGCSALTNITISGNVTGIGAYAFSGCSALTNVTISDGVTSIGAYAFSGCTNLTAIRIPDSVTSIGEGAFSDTGVDDSEIAYRRGSCGENLTWALLGGHKIVVNGTGAMTDYTSGSAPWYSYKEKITDVVISDGVTSIGSYAFEGCSVLCAVSLVDSLQRIGTKAFSGCTHLSEINIPEGITDISDYAFYQSGLTKIVYTGKDTVSIGDYAFAGCASLESVLIEAAALKTGNYIFNGCTKLEEVTISASFESMGSHMFANCTALSLVSLPKDCTAIGEYMFWGCTALSDITIPATVTELGSYAFGNCTGFSQITIPDSVTVIHAGAFSGCSGLKEIQLPSHIETIGDYAFQDCIGFTSVIVPSNVTGIGEGAFSGCRNLENITLPFVGGVNEAESVSAQTLFGYIFGSKKFDDATAAKQYYSDSGYVTYYLPDALHNVTITGGKILFGSFDDCSGLEHIVVPKGITDIGSYAFRGCTGSKDFVIPASVIDLGDYVFCGCTGLTSIKLPENIENIGSGAFSDCTELKDIKLPEKVTEIAGKLFQGCTQLQSVEMPEGVASIGDYAFSGCAAIESMVLSEHISEIGCGAFQNCTGLQGMEIPKGVTELKDYTFQGCTALERVTVAGELTGFGNYVFSGCTALTDILIPKTVTAIGNYAFQDCVLIENITIPAEVTEIGTGAFRNCSGLKSIKVPDSVVGIGSGAFSGCSGLKSMTLPFAGNTAGQTTASAKSLFGYIFGTASYTGGTATKQYYGGSSSSTYYIPDSLEKVVLTGGDLLYGTFYNCSGLTDITLPEDITDIGKYAFYNCSSLTKITLPEKLTSIGDYAFSGCSGLTGIALPSGITSIGTYAFQNCTGLKSVSIPNTVTAINTAAFSGCSGLKSMTLPFVGYSAEQTSASVKSLFGYIFGTTSYTGGTAAKQYYTGSSGGTYYIPSSLSKVEITGGNVLYGAFYNCSSLTEITLPKELTSIGNYAFSGCSGLTEITLPSGITSIGTYAFQNCTGLKSFSVPDKVTGISNYTFTGCTHLENISIPSGVTTIGTYAFQNCSSMVSIHIPDTVTAINSAAFSGCSSLENMTLPFVGYSASQTSASTKSHFGYIFGTTSYTGGTAVKQYYSSSGNYTYYIPSSLKTVELTGGNLLYGAFYNCSNLTSITLPDHITDIGKYAFYNCTGMTGIRIPSEVTGISAYAYANCSGVQTITFSGSAPSTIDATAFTRDTATVYYPVSDSSWSAYVGNQYGGTLTWEAHTHSYIAAVTDPTCTEQGYTTYRCSYCGSSYVSDYVNALGHQNIVTDAGVPAACTTTGLTEGSHCSVCQEIITAQAIIPATGHKFTGYVSNRDATYDADGTMTASCDYGCGAKDTITDTGSKLTDANKPVIEITTGTNRWTSFLNSITFGLFFQNTQTVTITASDNEELLDGSMVSRLAQVSYHITDTALGAEELEGVSWKKYTGSLSLNPSEKYIVYARAEDKSGNITYTSSGGIIVDDTSPVIVGLSEGAIYCRQAIFTVTDISLKSVTDNGSEIMASDGRYSIAGDDKQHNIIAIDDCGNQASVTVVITSDHKWGAYSYNNDATCLTAGTKTATCENGCGTTNTEIDETHPATGHSYEKPVFVWSDDFKSCDAIYTCTNDSSHVEMVSCAVKAESINATCTATGEVVYTATAVMDGKEATDSKNVSGAVLGHDYAAEFTWSADKSSCTVTLICQRAGCFEDTPNHALEARECTVETYTTAATCIQEGKVEVIAGITVEGVQYTEVGSTTVLPLDNTQHGNTQIINQKEATCLEEGYTGDTYCNDCKTTVSYGSVIPMIEQPVTASPAPDNSASPSPTGAETPSVSPSPSVPDNSASPTPSGTETPSVGPSASASENPASPSPTGAATPSVSPSASVLDNSASPSPSGTETPSVSPSASVPDNSALPSPSGAETPSISPSTAAPKGTDTPSPDLGSSPNPDQSSTPLNTSDVKTAPSVETPLPVETAAVPPVGTRIKDGKGVVYTVTKSSSTDGTVSYTVPENKNVTSVKIPATITIDGITYQVTAIANSAFANCKKLGKVTVGKNIVSIGNKAFYRCIALKKITLPAKLKKIGKKAFYGAENLKKIIFKTSKLKAKNVGAKAFWGIHPCAILNVPAQKEVAYKRLLKKRGVIGKKQKIEVME